MVQDAIVSLQPQYIILELCRERVDCLSDYQLSSEFDSLGKVFWEAIRQKSLKVLGMGLLNW